MRNPLAVGAFREAAYTESVLSRYGKNPLIEALPQMLRPEELMDKIRFDPICTEDDKKLSVEDKLQLIFNVNQFFQPMDVHYDLYLKAYNAIKSGYLTRNPTCIDYWQKLDEKIRGNIEFVDPPDIYFSLEGKSLGFPIIGMSGIGKSTSFRKVLRTIPQVIYHHEYNHKPFTFTQLSWLIVECPRNGSTKGYCENFFETVDKILKTNYRDIYIKPGGRTSEFIHGMKRVCGLHAIGIIGSDEIQVLSTAKSQGEKEMLNFFVELDNTLQVPMVLIGTDKARQLFKKDFRSARRADGQGDTPWQRMKSESDTWSDVVDSLLKINFLNIDPTPNEISKVKDALYDKSQGIIDIVVKLYILAQTRALLKGMEAINAAVINSVAKDSLNFVDGALDALRSGDLRKLNLYDDIYDLDLEERFKAEVARKLSKTKNPNSITKAADTSAALSKPEPRKNIDGHIKPSSEYHESGPCDLRKLYKQAKQDKIDF